MRVLVADPLARAGVEALSAYADVDVRTRLDRLALLAAIPAYDALVVDSATVVDADVIAAGSRLRAIGRAGIGLDNVDVRAATARGVVVCNAPQSNVMSAAEHTVALLLALVRNIPLADRTLRAGTWARSAFNGTELQGKTLGILGLGRVGSLVAQRCAAFGMRLLAYDPYLPAGRASALGVQLVPDVLDLCAQADVLTLHVPRTPETTGMIGEKQLRSMRPSARLVNTSRGGTVDERALHSALTEGWIAGAALDVFDTEPLLASPLFDLDNVVLTPHLGAATREAEDRAAVMVAESIVCALRGEFVPSAVNMPAAAVADEVRPFVPLMEKLGRLFSALYHSAGELTVEYVGWVAQDDTQVLTLSALKGLLVDAVHEPVTFVNAQRLAEERGLVVSTLTAAATRDYVSLVRLCAGDVSVAGTLTGPANRERFVEVWGFDVDMEPSGHMVFFRYTDRPGVIGTIGRMLGEADVNIATMQVGRREAGGEQLVALAVDSAVPPPVIEAIADAIEAIDARVLDLS